MASKPVGRSAAGRVIYLVLGAIVIGLAQVAAGWWLDSGVRVTGVAAALAVLAAVGAQREGHASSHAIETAAGAMAASIAILLVQGPGTIWPIVLGVALLVVGMAVAAGAGTGVLLRRSRR